MSVFEFLWDDRARQAWNDITQADLNTGITPTPVIEARKVEYWAHYPKELLDEQRQFEASMNAFKAQWAAMTPAERAEWTRQRDARLAAEKEARTCKTCGCDPDDHGGY